MHLQVVYQEPDTEDDDEESNTEDPFALLPNSDDSEDQPMANGTGVSPSDSDSD